MITPEWWLTVICEDCECVAWFCECGDDQVVTTDADLTEGFLQSYAGEHHLE